MEEPHFLFPSLNPSCLDFYLQEIFSNRTHFFVILFRSLFSLNIASKELRYF